MSKHKVSVIITTYDRPKRLKKAIESVIKQSFKDWELIIADDATKGDDVAKVIKSFKSDRIIHNKAAKNHRHHAKPKNDALKIAKGDYIAYLDDDNEFKTDHLQILYNELIRNPEIDVAFGERDIIAEEKTPDGKDFPIVKGICLQSMLDSFNKAAGINPPLTADTISQNMMMTFVLKQNYIDTSDVMHKREIIFDVGGWNEKQPKFGDWQLWCRLMKAGYTFKYVAISITDYHMHAKMKSMTVKSKVINTKGQPYLHPTYFDPVDCYTDEPFLKKVEKPKIAIWTITWNRLDYTKKMIESMKKNFKYDYDHYFIDNGSTDGTKEYLKKMLEKKASYKPIKDVIFNEDNLGISKANNIALNAILVSSKVKYDIVIKVDNDCEILSPDMLKTIAKIYQINRKMVISPYIEGLIDHPGGGKRIPGLRGRIGDYRVSAAEHMGGIFRAVPTKVFKNWRWPENDFKHGIQDLAFSQYAISSGYQLQYLDDFRAGHIDSTYEQDKKYPEYSDERAKAKIQRSK